VRFANRTGHPHSIHFHGIHPASFDGVPGSGAAVIAPGGSTTYEFEAAPFGMHLYHCHAFPLAIHIARGLYGAFVIDPAGGRPEADEMVMVMNGFDLDADGENEMYAVNTIPFAYMAEPIRVQRDAPVRIHLVNAVEYDPINSFHVHANLFEYIPTGTARFPSEFTDTVMLCQGQRGIIEARFPHPGRYMFHAHQSEFTELGWMGEFEVA
jgi:FtsP/CotA-like multicopper oxidase with cupredoxin domain